MDLKASQAREFFEYKRVCDHGKGVAAPNPRPPGRDIISVRVGALDLLSMELEDEEKIG